MNFNDETELLDALNAEGTFHGKPRVRFRDYDTLRPFFSGYPLPPGSKQTVQQLENFYTHGIGATNQTEAEYRADIGQPISGDQTARWRAWQERGEGFPSTHDIPHGTPIITPKGALF